MSDMRRRREARACIPELVPLERSDDHRVKTDSARRSKRVEKYNRTRCNRYNDRLDKCN
jgi:hypothetical protein